MIFSTIIFLGIVLAFLTNLFWSKKEEYYLNQEKYKYSLIEDQRKSEDLKVKDCIERAELLNYQETEAEKSFFLSDSQVEYRKKEAEDWCLKYPGEDCQKESNLMFAKILVEKFEEIDELMEDRIDKCLKYGQF